ncbi:MAG: biotin--[acetyl-CoA-carboxylase] ligase [Acidobacteriota bacterium]
MEFRDFSQRLLAERDPALAMAVVATVGSTHTLGRRLIDEAGEEPESPPVAAVDLVAWEQTAGRGRDNRRWSSPPGCGIYLTLVRTLSRGSLQLLPLIVGATLVDAIESASPRQPVRLAWPNDLVAGDVKLGGLLIDAVSRANGDTAAVVSFGINHSGPLEQLAAPRPTSLEALAVEGDLASWALRLRDAVDARLRSTPDAAQVLADYRRLSAHRAGDRLSVRDGNGGRIEGTFLGVDARGFLRLDVDGEERLLSAGRLDA